MKTPPIRPVTRMSPIGTAAYNSRWLATFLAGSSLLGGAALATDWDGSTSSDWNDITNWVGDNGTGGSNALININIPPAVISASITATPVDILVGSGAGTTGRLDHTAGTAATGGGNWMVVGRENGTGVYNLANTAATGGTLTGFGLGSGSMNVGSASGTNGRLYVGGANYAGSTGIGTVNVNTSGTLSIKNDLAVGSAGGTGIVNVDAGAITTGGWNFIGKVEADVQGGNGTLNMSGGTLTNTGRTYVGQIGTTGAINLSGGSYLNVNNEQFIFGEGVGSQGSLSITSPASVLQSGGELWFGQAGGTGSLNMSAGTINVNNWVAVGRDGGTGTVTMTGGTINKTGNGNNFIIGSSGPGTWTQSGGLVDVVGGITWIGENNAATMTLSGTAEWRTSNFTVAANGASSSVVGLDGGTLRAGQILGGGGTAEIDFNGTQIVATAAQANFISGLDLAPIEAGGLKVDTNGFAVTVPQIFDGIGGVTKSGNGTLTLTGASLYTGAEASNAGILMVSTDSLNTANDVTVANGAGYGVAQNIADTVLQRNNVTFGTSAASRLDFNLGNLPGNPTIAPLKVNGTLRLNGPVTINLADQLPEVGTIPLVSYTGPKAGTGAFVLGTLPNGVVATLSDNGTGLVSLTITSVALPYWDGTVSNVWDTTIANWVNLVGGAAVTYKNGNPVLFDDLADGPGGDYTNVVLSSTVTPANVTFNNSLLSYTLSGTGKISGITGLIKKGTSPLTLGTLNDYTGVTTVEGGTLSIPTLTNGSTASSIGAATPAPANLVFNGGTLEYTGPTTTTDRGFTINGANSVLSLQNDLTISGPIVSTGGTFTKAGPGNLTLTNPVNQIGSANPALSVSGGTLTLDGAGTQVNTLPADLWVGNTPDVPAAVVLKNTTLNVGGWIALGRGNGSTGTVSSFSATNSTITSVNMSTGFDGGLGGNDSDQTITLNNSNWTNNGATLLGESLNSTTNITISGTSHFQANDRLQMGLGQGSVVNMVIENSGSITKTGGWLSIGNGSNGTANVLVKDSGSLSANGDFNIGDVDTSTGNLTIEGSGTVTSTNIAFIGKNGGTTGNIIQTSGTFNGNSWISVGRFNGATGTVNVSGGTFNQTSTGDRLIIGEEGRGTMTISGTGAVNAAADFVVISNAASAIGTLNLNGGTLTARRIAEGGGNAGSATINFNGGLLRVGANPNADFLSGLDGANVLAGGVRIDTNGSNIAILQPLLDTGTTGGLIKTGAGDLQLNGANTYTGTTTVTTGTLAGSGSIAGPLVVSSGTTIAPGLAAPGTFTVAGATTVSGTYACEIDDGINDTLAVTGSLNVSGATLAITTLAGGATQPAYVIATYTGATPAPFASVTGLPPGYAVNYAYNDGLTSTNVAIVSTAVPAAYAAWISTYFPGSTDPAVIGTTADPDKDGNSNALEFALGGLPNSGSNNAKIYSLAADSSADADTTSELLLTIAVRTGSPVFTGSPSPSSSLDGFTVTVQGGTVVDTFTSVVTPVAVVSTGLPVAPSGYEYRTFSLAGSNGLPGKGFLRARVSF